MLYLLSTENKLQQEATKGKVVSFHTGGGGVHTESNRCPQVISQVSVLLLELLCFLTEAQCDDEVRSVAGSVAAVGGAHAEGDSVSGSGS